MKKHFFHIFILLTIILSFTKAPSSTISDDGNNKHSNKYSSIINKIDSTILKISDEELNDISLFQSLSIIDYSVNRYNQTNNKSFLTNIERIINNLSNKKDKSDSLIYNVILAKGYLNLYQLTDKDEYKRNADKIIKLIIDKFYNKEDNCFKGCNIRENTLIIQTFILGYGVFGRDEYIKIAEDLITSLMKSERQNNLWEKIYIMDAMMDCYEATGNNKYLTYLQNNIGSVICCNNLEEKLYEYSSTAIILFELSHITDDKEYKEKGNNILESISQKEKTVSTLQLTEYGFAIDWTSSNPVEIHIVGSVNHPSTKKLLREALKLDESKKIIEVLDPTEDKEKIEKLSYPVTESAKLFVCVGKSCSFPISAKDNVSKKINEFLKENQ